MLAWYNIQNGNRNFNTERLLSLISDRETFLEFVSYSVLQKL